MYKHNDALKALRSHIYVNDMYRKQIALSVHTHRKALKWVSIIERIDQPGEKKCRLEVFFVYSSFLP